jgi:DNA-binding CsgD family transcriptional regulator
MATQPESKTSQRKLTARERELKALSLRKKGWTYARIGDSLDITCMGAYNAVMRALKKLNEKISEEAEQVRTLELQRLDRMFEKMYDKAINSKDQGAVDRCLRIMDRRAKLLGLDAPERKDITSKGEQIKPVELVEVIIRESDGE